MTSKLLIPLVLALTFISNANAQQTDSIADVRRPTFAHRMMVPAILIGAGVALNGNGAEGFKKEIAEIRANNFSKFRTRADDYLQFSPIFIAYGLDALGYRSKTDIRNRSMILLKGELMMTGIVFGVKTLTHQLRPDNSSYTSFPSGHTAQAFAAATFLSEEYKDRFHWMPFVSYGIAGTVGMLRMANNKHYISDVLLGAGIGMLSMKTAYLTHKYIWNKRQVNVPSF